MLWIATKGTGVQRLFEEKQHRAGRSEMAFLPDKCFGICTFLLQCFFEYGTIPIESRGGIYFFAAPC